MRDFDPSESMENVGILDVFPIFHTARLGQKIRRSPQLPPKRCCPREIYYHAILCFDKISKNSQFKL